MCDAGWTGHACNVRVKVDNDDDECVPDCSGKHCGSSGCPRVSCGMCERHEHCNDGACKCSPRCEGKFCGDDGCGAYCGVCMGETETCNESSGQCLCTPSCENKECGFDGCYHVCGNCPSDKLCVNYQCVVGNRTRSN